MRRWTGKSSARLTLMLSGIALAGCTDDPTEPYGATARGVATSLAVVEGAWTPKAPMPTGRGGLGVGVVNGVVYAVGGGTAALEAYDPATNTWTAKAPMSTPRYGLGVGVLNGVLYAIGGSSGVGCGGVLYSSVEAYDPATNTWTPRAPLPFGKCELGAAIAVDGLLYVVGGLSSGGRLGTVDAYNPVTNTWTSKASMPTGRGWAGISVLNGIIYAVGGVNNASGIVATVEAYDQATNTWITKASLPTARYAPAAATVGTTLYAIGGLVDPTRTTVDAYNPAADAWEPAPAMSTPRGALGAGVVNGVVYAVGGYTNPFNGLTTVEAFTPVAPPPPPIRNIAPVANAGSDQSVNLVGSSSATVELDGGASTDDGLIASLTYSWAEGTVALGSGKNLDVTLGIGVHAITLTVFDGELASTDEVLITIVDPTPPILTSSVSGTLGRNGWYTSTVTVTFAVADPESAITSTPCASPQTQSIDTESQTFSCTATSAGGTSSHSETFKLDGTDPTVVFSGSLSYTVDQTVLITCTPSDNLSGVASSGCGSPVAAGPASTFPLGDHVRTVRAADRAGNTTAAAVTFKVRVTSQSLANLVTLWVTDQGLANSLSTKLSNAAASFSSGNTTAARNQLNAFINHVEAQRGKKIPADQAALLIAYANALL